MLASRLLPECNINKIYHQKITSKNEKNHSTYWNCYLHHFDDL